ncbi:MAG: hypothetical protein K8I82_17445, partial [Anaerolineae bacterium]|nr:hypothetical protein [Anaerolineae bacterium]
TAQFLWEGTYRYTMGGALWYHSSVDTVLGEDGTATLLGEEGSDVLLGGAGEAVKTFEWREAA